MGVDAGVSRVSSQLLRKMQTVMSGHLSKSYHGVAQLAKAWRCERTKPTMYVHDTQPDDVELATLL